eukprot:CAMPEP_0181089218 /NCGR_PEP_ID=MMETSP1071-20121207/7187_1 /TAXON_ID=35127 /ORGANISM="Thalassiosira sp., Strain NH16" /LENGTH=685 /DNA_ID=CAMNT_0023171155 /DNA_START=174 /DNA_END=2231 /DNA_ORIENTATION=+
MSSLLKSLLLVCLAQQSVPFGFGIARSEVRANRAPIAKIGCSSSETRRYGASSSSGSAVDKDADGKANSQLEQNTKYVEGLIRTLDTLLEQWKVSGGAMATRRRAYNILQQIERLSMDKDLTLKAEKNVEESGMPTDPPPPMPPTEHIPAVDQPQPQTCEQYTAKIVKPTGAMDDVKPMPHSPKGYKTSEAYDMNVGSLLNSSSSPPSSSSDGKERKSEVDERLAWEKKHREKSDSTINNLKEDAPPRSALSARLADSKGGDPFLNGVMEGNKNLDKKQHRDTTVKGTSRSTSTSDDRNMKRASAKFSELIARAGSGDAFLGSSLGVGGLDDVLAQVQRRVWIPLAAPPTLLSELGIQPVRGMLLYGSPGCGKTLLARKLGSILSPCRPITIVSGPEILDKFVGSSEKNLREVFDNPPEIYLEYKKNYGKPLESQALHVIVLDEFDAIARRRGGSGGKGDQGDAGVARDSVVNQLLAKMDGVDGLGVPTLLVGLTNKPSLIDPALMRPGRFEVQIEVPKPRTVGQRVAILKVHTESMVKNGRVLVKDAPEGTAAWKSIRRTGYDGIPSYEELLDVIAVECDGMSGASLAGVARAAASRALERAVTDFAGHIASDTSVEEGNSISDCLVTQSDFEKAIEDVFESAKGGDYTESDDSAEKETRNDSDTKNEFDRMDSDDGISTNPPL